VLLRQDVVRAGLEKPATGTDITDASLPQPTSESRSASLESAPNLI
jgi:hypothetical protein